MDPNISEQDNDTSERSGPEAAASDVASEKIPQTKKRKRKKRKGARKKGGRPSKLTPGLRKKIESLLQAGNRRSIVIRSVGISETTFYRWMQWGERRSRGKYREFWEGIKAAEAEAEILYLDQIRKAARDGKWQAAAWFLERKLPKVWGRTVRETQQLRIDVTKLSDEQLERIAAGEDPIAVLAATGESRDRGTKTEGDL